MFFWRKVLLGADSHRSLQKADFKSSIREPFEAGGHITLQAVPRRLAVLILLGNDPGLPANEERQAWRRVP